MERILLKQTVKEVLKLHQEGERDGKVCKAVSEVKVIAISHSKQGPQLTQMLTRNISDIHHTDDNIQLCRPTDQCLLSMCARKRD